jgi:hypothetical protein
MSALLRILFPLIGYFCVAATITTVAGYGYLRHKGVLDNETMFQIVSLVHGVDLDAIAEENKTDVQDIPPEEMSFEDQQRQILMTTLHLQAKKDDIEKNISSFKSERTLLDNTFNHVQKFKLEVETFLNSRKRESSASGLLAVRNQWKILNPKQTKQVLVRMVSDGKMNTVIELLNGLSPKEREAIFKTFTTEEDIALLYDIENQMLNGGPESAFIDNKLQELKQKDN